MSEYSREWVHENPLLANFCGNSQFTEIPISGNLLCRYQASRGAGTRL
jgi:hypothetical protein